MSVRIFTFVLVIFTNLSAQTLNESWLNLLAQNNFEQSKQSYCFLLADKTILSDNLNQKIRPASVSKLFTSLWALEKLSKDYKHSTKFSVKGNTLYITGSNDPFFVSENLLVVVGEIQKSHTIKNILFDKNFYFNWTKNKNSIKTSLLKVLDSKSWSASFQDTVDKLELFINDYRYDYVIAKDVKISSINYQANINKKENSTVYEYYSSPLWMHLKQVNIYSNNFYADSIFEKLGGAAEFHKYLYKKFNIDKSDTYFYTGSGLGENRTTCATTIKVLSALQTYTKIADISLTDLVSVAGVDEGTLSRRFKHELNRQVLAKTGTLRHTSTLAGFLDKTHKIAFAIFNHTYELNSARVMQESFLYQFSLLNKIFSFEYEPKEYVSIQETNIKKGTI